MKSDPAWRADGRCFCSRKTAAFDDRSVKDPSIIYLNGSYHLFYTGYARSGTYSMGYASGPSIESLALSERTLVDLRGAGTGSYGAPEVFFFEPHGLWYLFFQVDGLGGCYATTRDVADPLSWDGPHPIGITAGWDFFVICDDGNAYLFYTPPDDSRTILTSKTGIRSFPSGFEKSRVAIRDAFEGTCVYRSLADGMYYLLVEHLADNRYYQLHYAESPDGPWIKVSELWASYRNLTYLADRWTDNVSHGELLRAGVNQRLEIRDINRADFLVQGAVSGDYGGYEKIPWDLGFIRNYD
jgi:hypothetical protein